MNNPDSVVRLLETVGSLRPGELKIVSAMAKKDSFTIADAITATGYTDRAIRKIIAELSRKKLVHRLELGGGQRNRSHYQIRLTHEATAMAS